MSLSLKHGSDGFGFKYGFVDIGAEAPVRVDVMPPEPVWMGTMRLPESRLPDPKHWVVFVEGEEVGRVATEREASDLITQVINRLRDEERQTGR